MKKILALFLCLECSWAGQDPLESSKWYEEKNLDIVYSTGNEFWSTKICADKKFDIYLKEETKLAEEQITEIKNLPPLTYTCLPLKESGEPDFDLSNWSFIEEGDAIVVINPTERQIFATGNLHDCVGIAIISPQKTLFAHLVHNILAKGGGKMLSDEQLPLLLKQLTAAERLHSRAILVSSCYSCIFADAYTTLLDAGITNISIDVEPFLHRNQEERYIKSSVLKMALSTFEGEDIEKLENTLRQSYSAVSGRNLIINVKTGEVYSFRDSSQKHRDINILSNWERQKKFSFKLTENCFTLRDYLYLTGPVNIDRSVLEDFVRQGRSSN